MSDYVDDLIQSPQPVEAEIVEDDLMISSASFEIDMSGIQSDVAELTEAIDDALTVYGESLVDSETIATIDRVSARERELELSRAIRAADELRRKLNRDYKVPLDVAKGRYDELMGPVIELHAAYKQRRVDFEEAEREQKLTTIRALYEAMAPRWALAPLDGDAPVPFQAVFDRYGGKWLNKGTSLDAVERELGGVVAMLDEGERRLDEAGLKHSTEAKAVFWRTFDVEAAFARDRELCAFEERQAAKERQASATQEVPLAALAQLAQPAQPAAAPNASDPAAERKPRVMLIEGATDDECRQIAALCKSLGIQGVFKGPQSYAIVKEWLR